MFKQVGIIPYVKNSDIVKDLVKSASGNYEFTETVRDWYEKIVNMDICNTLFLWTGKATFKVGGSSCTLSGTIWCPSKAYNTYGTYGIPVSYTHLTLPTILLV